MELGASPPEASLAHARRIVREHIPVEVSLAPSSVLRYHGYSPIVSAKPTDSSSLTLEALRARALAPIPVA